MWTEEDTDTDLGPSLDLFRKDIKRQILGISKGEKDKENLDIEVSQKPRVGFQGGGSGQSVKISSIKRTEKYSLDLETWSN